jgi:hypothetical protein
MIFYTVHSITLSPGRSSGGGGVCASSDYCTGNIFCRNLDRVVLYHRGTSHAVLAEICNQILFCKVRSVTSACCVPREVSYETILDPDEIEEL